MDNITANGAQVPQIGFGTFRIPEADTARAVSTVLKQGYRHIDTAQIYGNEKDVGDGIKRSGIDRSSVFLTTKVWVDHYPRDRFHNSVDDSLQKLQTDYVDLLLLHWPSDAVPLSDQIGALNELQSQGKVRHIGVSNFTVALLNDAVALSDSPIVTNQIEYHPFINQHTLIARARQLGVSTTAYFAMADGKVFANPTLQHIAAQHGRSVAQIVLRWLVQQESVIALSKTVSEDRARANLDIFDFSLPDADMQAISMLANVEGRIVSPDGLAPAWDPIDPPTSDNDASASDVNTVPRESAH